MKYITPHWPVPANIKAFTTCKSGWDGRKLYYDVSRGYIAVGEPNCHTESEALQSLLNLPDEPIWLTQTHSTHAVAALPANQEKCADASFTSEFNRVCAVLTADCLPILLCNMQGTTVVAIHAGWRGLAQGIIENTLGSINQPASSFIAWLGPAISQKNFEVGSDVYESFLNDSPKARAAFKSHTPGKWLADLYLLAKLKFESIGLTKVYGGDFCTFSQQDLFFSYRRDKGKTGRMVSLIWIEPI